MGSIAPQIFWQSLNQGWADYVCQGRNQGENLVASSAMQWWAKSAPPGGDRLKIPENFGATAVLPVAPVDTSLYYLSNSFQAYIDQNIV